VVILDLEGNANVVRSSWPLGKVIHVNNRKVKEVIHRGMNSKLTPFHTRVLAAMDMEKNK